MPMKAIQRGKVVLAAATPPITKVEKRITAISAEKSHRRPRKWTIARKILRHNVLFMVTAP
jgi:hypothetical protein